MVSSSHVQAWAGLPHIPRNPGDPTRAFAYVANCVQRHAIGLQAFLTYLFNRDLPIFDRLLSMLVQAGWSQVMILAVAASISIHQRVFGQRWAVALEEFAVTCAILAFHRLNLLDKWADQVWASISSAAPVGHTSPGPGVFFDIQRTESFFTARCTDLSSRPIQLLVEQLRD